jgi:putative hemolysin
MLCETPAEPKCNEYATENKNTWSIGLANPASTNCVNNWGKLEIVDTTWWQVGMCTTSDGTICEERAYYRSECGDTNIAKVCTEEAKICPDGSSVGRTWPNCEFAPCPSEESVVCTMEYMPVCASVAVQCVKAPCLPIEQTFSNKCMMNANKLAKFLYKGECWSANR